MLSKSLGWPCVFVMAVSLGSAAVTVAQDDGSARALLDQGLTRWREGNVQQAIRLFEKALAADPTNDVIVSFLGDATLVEIMRMVRSDNPRISGVGRTLLRLRRQIVKERISDPERIAKAVQETYAADGQEQLVLKLRYASMFGRNLVPALVEKLGDVDVGNRVLAMTWISEIGRDAVPVLLAAAGHSSEIVRLSVAKLLGVAPLRHPISAGTLARLVETDPEKAVRDAAAASLVALAGERVRPAKDYFYASAETLFLSPSRNDFNKPYYKPTVYHLRDDRVVGEEVVDFQLNERMAEQQLHAALEIDPEFAKGRQLMLCCDALLAVEFDEGLELYADDAEAMAILERQKPVMEYVVEPRLLAASKSDLFGALGLALGYRENHVAESLLDVARKTFRRGPAPRPVLDALLSSLSRSVRVHAAALLAESRPADLPGSARQIVVEVLAEAVQNSGIRVAHKVMGNPDNVKRFDRLFRETNVDSFSNSDDVEEGLARAAQVPPDFIVVDTAIRSGVARDIAPVNFFVRRLRKNPRTAEIPVIVVVDAATYDEDKGVYENEELNVHVVSSDVDRATFEAVITPLLEGSEDAKARATALGVLAATVLESISEAADFPVGAVVKTLEASIRSRPDPIRVRCLGVLGNLREQALGSAGAIAQLAASDENSVEIREAALLAVGKILDATDAPAPAGILRIIEAGMNDSDLRIRRASYFAYSAAKAPASDLLPRLHDVAPPGEADTTAAAGGEEGGEA